MSSIHTKSVLKKIAESALGYPAPLELRRSLESLEQRDQAAVCLLFAGNEFLSSKILLTERAATLPTHAGQVAFPGGVLEEQDQNNLSITALRECWEETGIPQSGIEVIGVMPEFPTLKGSFEVTPVLACWRFNELPEIQLSEEVVEAEWVSVKELFSTRSIETHLLRDVEVKSPYFMWKNKKMWGVSAWIFDLIYARYGTLRL